MKKLLIKLPIICFTLICSAFNLQSQTNSPDSVIQIIDRTREVIGIKNFNHLWNLQGSGDFQQKNSNDISSGGISLNLGFSNHYKKIIDVYIPEWRIKETDNLTLTNAWIDIMSNRGGHGRSGSGKIWRQHLESLDIKEAVRLDYLRLFASLFLLSPDSHPLDYSFDNETNLNGTNMNAFTVKYEGKFLMRLFISKQTALPVMITYKISNPPVVIFSKDRKLKPDNIKTDDVQLLFYEYKKVINKEFGSVLLPYRFILKVNDSIKDTWDIKKYSFPSTGVKH